MHCPLCGHEESRVLDSRTVGDTIRRRRECLSCQKRFTTYERIEEAPLMVIKKDGRREQFDRAKILAGLRRACEKRPIAVATLESLADQIEREIRQRMEQEVPSREIGEHLMEALRRLDEVAYVRFASVYREFKDLETFRRELDTLRP